MEMGKKNPAAAHGSGNSSILPSPGLFRYGSRGSYKSSVTVSVILMSFIPTSSPLAVIKAFFARIVFITSCTTSFVRPCLGLESVIPAALPPLVRKDNFIIRFVEIGNLFTPFLKSLPDTLSQGPYSSSRSCEFLLTVISTT
ncbi:hypothetical protein DSY1720 [Desulfitobacterium hafniense Y51]|uniref:Uncharacterized protein n=1 Tax=Desulfitobacterium hafniense (strain Y51) TaxID=138119 RepID=Q24WT3_DESHY|nr:hypothetical protein DSY1720 [Desulfitobacterium hafniense Y51]